MHTLLCTNHHPLPHLSTPALTHFGQASTLNLILRMIKRVIAIAKFVCQGILQLQDGSSISYVFFYVKIYPSQATKLGNLSIAMSLAHICAVSHLGLQVRVIDPFSTNNP